jgi:hypothetical protein
MLSKVCSSGVRGFYIQAEAGDGHKLKLITSEEAESLPLQVFDGDFTVKRDMEALVCPMLGLYGKALRQKESPLMGKIVEMITKDKDKFFPKTYFPEGTGGTAVERILFGPLVKMLEESVLHNPQGLNGRNQVYLIHDAKVTPAS